MKPPRDSSAADRRELHREKMRNKAARRARWHAFRNTPAQLKGQRRWGRTFFTDAQIRGR